MNTFFYFVHSNNKAINNCPCLRLASRWPKCDVYVILKCFLLVRYKTARLCHLSVLRMNQTEECVTKRVSC